MPFAAMTTGSHSFAYLSSHASKMILLCNGNLFCTWFSGSNEGDSNVAIVVARLKKGEKTWSPAVLVD
jgi:predicted neuraminidase